MLRSTILAAAFAPLSIAASDVSLVTDIIPGAPGSYPSYLTVHGDHLYFRANSLSGGNDVELWRFDGATAERVADISPGPDGSSPADLTFHGEVLYFSARACASCGVQLFRYDGTGVSAAPGSSSGASNPQDLVVFGGVLYFRAFRSNIGIELWKFDGVTQTPIDIFSGTGSSYPHQFIKFDGKLYMNANGAPGDGSELYYLDGSGVHLGANIHPTDGSSPEWPVLFNGDLYFSARGDEKGRELWRFDRIQAARVTDIFPGPEASNPTGMTDYDGAIYFSAEEGIHGYELWRFDGTNAELVANINPNPVLDGADPIHHSNPAHFIVFDGILYFVADDGTHGEELWSCDGRTVSMVADIWPGPVGSNITELVVYRDALYFTANDGEHGGELGYSVSTLWRLTPRPEASFRRGDPNADGEGDVSDAVSILLYLFGGQSNAVACEKAADLDDNGLLDLTDAVSLLGVLFLGVPAPPEPFAACGVDPTQDNLSCGTPPDCP